MLMLVITVCVDDAVGKIGFCCCYVIFVFFFKQKTAYEMRISDWSSDVCSSDLSLQDETLRILFLDGIGRLIADEQVQRGTVHQLVIYPRPIFRRAMEHNAASLILEIGRAHV